METFTLPSSSVKVWVVVSLFVTVMSVEPLLTVSVLGSNAKFLIEIDAVEPVEPVEPVLPVEPVDAPPLSLFASSTNPT